MLDRNNNSINAADCKKHREVGRKREPDIVVLIVAFFAGGAIICTALFVPILLAAVSEMTQPPGMTYQQCGAIKQEPDRLACYDRVLRQITLHSAKEVHPIASGQAEQSNPQ
jgi:hypothetical protein